MTTPRMRVAAYCLGAALTAPLPLAAMPEEPRQAAPAAPVQAGQAACTCEAARLDTGWCERHGVGYVASIPIRSRLLYETLDAHGHTLDPDAFTCEICRVAIRTDGFCEKDRIGFVRTQAYFSRLTYELARGERLPPGTIDCPACRKNAESLGWCERCRVGMIGSVHAKDRLAYDKASAAVVILVAANETAARCEECAVAMITDSLCARHRISYREGKPVAAPAAP
ncbi:MAG TPA: hypothetical protein VFP98_06660 [Candidatus Polarisedimenticolia bacterium]|nr:hypothetical protein [Candidatus Polarisedimenticolia bacterium]